MQKILVLTLTMALLGCGSYPIQFVPCSTEANGRRFEVISGHISGSASHFYFLGLGGNGSQSITDMAYQNALLKADGANALTEMSVEVYRRGLFPLFWREGVTISGTAIKFVK